jgi:type I restriction enzyme M protein
VNKDTQTTALVQKVWQYAHVLKDDGLAFMDYTEQITYLMFLKMAWEESLKSGAAAIPARYTWGALKKITDNAARLERYHQGLRKLSDEPGLIGLIFAKPQSKINDPAKLSLLIQMIDSEDWTSLDMDVKGQVYEGLLARNADDVRGGAGQYFTPRPVIQAIVQAMRPTPTMRISDPACGTGGFLLAAFEYLSSRTANKREDKFLRTRALIGNDLVSNVVRLCAMNMFLRGIGTDPDYPTVTIGDSLEKSSEPVDMILTNPPFGRKSSFTIVGQDGKKLTDKISYERADFWATTSNKQLNFVQHIYTSLKKDGRAAVVVPDNVLFEGGAGEKIRRSLLASCDVHTMLRLPVGIWYSPGVQANVIFFDRVQTRDESATKELWIYDLRSGQNFSLRNNPIRSHHLDDFVLSYCADDRSKRRESSVFRRFSIDELRSRDKLNLDIQWLKAPTASTGETAQSLMSDILNDLREAIEEFSVIEDTLRNAR